MVKQKKDSLVWAVVNKKFLTSVGNKSFNDKVIIYDTFTQVKARAKREGRTLKKL